MKSSIKMALGRFCAHGMVRKYAESSYIPASQKFLELTRNNAEEARRINSLHQRLKTNWQDIKIDYPVRNYEGPFLVSDQVEISVTVNLGNIRPEEVEVQLCYGKMKNVEKLETVNIETMNMIEDLGKGRFKYSTSLLCNNAGRFGVTARIIPSGDNYLKHSPGLITWA